MKNKNSNEIKQLKSKDIEKIRTDILEEQDGCCAICGCKITDETGATLDHQHKTSKETNGVDGAGLIRGVLCRTCNFWEGKIWNNTTRFHQPDSVQTRVELLEKLISYYTKQQYKLIHPSEREKQPNVSKRNYNKLKKLYESDNRRAKIPEYPKSKKLTLGLQILFEEYKIEPFN